jgi:Zn-dependent protease with chaperone function
MAYEHLIELTAPYSLEVSSCLLTIFTQICALLFTLLHNVIIDASNHLAANLTMFGLMVIGCVLTAVNKTPSRLTEADAPRLSPLQA